MSKWGAAGKGAASGAAQGAAFGPWGAGAGALIGGVSSLIQGAEREKMLEETLQAIENRPDLRDSEAYKTATTEAAKANRRAQQGFSSQEMNQAQDAISRTGGTALATATSLESGLLGQARAQQSMADSYRSLFSDDNAIKRANQQTAYNETQDLQDMQTQAYNVDLGKAQDILAAKQGVYEAQVNDSNNLMAGMAAGAQGLADVGTGNWEGFGNNFKGMFNKTNTPTTNTNTPANTSIPLGYGNGYGSGMNGVFGSPNVLNLD